MYIINLNQINSIQGVQPYSQPHTNQKQDNYMSQSKAQYPGQYTSQYIGGNNNQGIGVNMLGGNTGQGVSSYQPLQQKHPYSQTSFTKPQQILEADIPSQTQWLQGGVQPSMSHTGYIHYMYLRTYKNVY
jgi:hypothetical protein